VGFEDLRGEADRERGEIQDGWREEVPGVSDDQEVTREVDNHLEVGEALGNAELASSLTPTSPQAW
jgi:hypothetical protein